MVQAYATCCLLQKCPHDAFLHDVFQPLPVLYSYSVVSSCTYLCEGQTALQAHAKPRPCRRPTSPCTTTCSWTAVQRPHQVASSRANVVQPTPSNGLYMLRFHKKSTWNAIHGLSSSQCVDGKIFRSKNIPDGQVTDRRRPPYLAHLKFNPSAGHIERKLLCQALFWLKKEVVSLNNLKVIAIYTNFWLRIVVAHDIRTPP